MKVSGLRKALEGVQDELEVVASGSGRFFDKVLDADRVFAHDEREGFRKPVGCIVQMGEAPRVLVFAIEPAKTWSANERGLLEHALGWVRDARKDLSKLTFGGPREVVIAEDSLEIAEKQLAEVLGEEPKS